MRIYTSYLCTVSRCKKEFVLLTEDLDEIKNNRRYITCPYCSSKKVKRIKETDSIKECMGHAVYKREKRCFKANKIKRGT